MANSLRIILCALAATAFALAGIQPKSGRAATQPELEDFYSRAREAIHRGEYDIAIRLGEQSLSFARQTADRRREGAALSVIGNAYFFMDRCSEALETFQKCLAIMRETADPYGEASALKDVGITYKRLGRYQEAIESLQEALTIARGLNASYEVGSILENLAGGYAGLGAFNLAFEMYQQTLEIAEQAHSDKLRFSVLIRIGNLYNSIERPDRALDYFTQAMSLAKQQDLSPVNHIWMMQESASTLAAIGRADEAIKLRQRSLALGRKIGWKTGIAQDLQGLGYIYMDRDPALALSYFKQSLALFEQVDSPLRWGAYASLARAYRRLRHLDLAVKYYQKAVDLLESFRGHLVSEQLKATFLGKQQPVYQELMETLIERHEQNPEAGDDARAFALYELSKARALLEAIAEARLDSERDLEPGLRRKQKELDARIAELGKHLIGANLTEKERRQSLELLGEAEREYDRLAVEIRGRDPRHINLRRSQPLSIEQAQALLDETTMMIAYAVTNEGVFAFVLTAGTFRAVRLAVSPKVITMRVQSYVDLLAQAGQPGWQEVSLRLYADLAAPLLKHLRPAIKRLIIVPDSILHYLPFETLIRDQKASDQPIISRIDDSNATRLLLEDFVISYAPSVAVLGQLKASQKILGETPRADLLMLANPAIAAGLEPGNGSNRAADFTQTLYDDEGLSIAPLPFSVSEAREVKRYAGPGSIIYTGQEASERHIKTSDLHGFRVIHFSTHGLISQRRPERSALMLAAADGDGEDGFLQAREIFHLGLASDLVVLSACQSARGQILGGEGAQSLAQAFFYAGAQSVIASLWSVNDESAAIFMKRFYQHLASGQPKAEALRATKLDLLKERASSNPRDWAAFILIGEENGRVPMQGPTPWLRTSGWMLCGAGFVLLLSLLLFRSRAKILLFRGGLKP